MGTWSKSLTRKKPAAPRWTPHAYQRKAMKFLLGQRAAALFLDPGLGKTSIALGAFQTLKRMKLSRGMLVLAPLRVATNVWPGQVAEWAEFKDLRVVVLHGEGKKAADEEADIFVINYEGLPWLIESGALDRMLRSGRVDTLVVDELSKFKHTNTKRFKALKGWLHRFQRRWGLTGSPAANNLMDLFGEIYVLDRGARLGQYITHFRARYFVPAGPYDWRLIKGGEAEIYKSIADVALRMAAEDYLALPPQLDNVVSVHLPAAARKMYDAMEDELVASLAGRTLTAPNTASALNKCRQIAGGAIYDEVQVPHTVHEEKMSALMDIVEEAQGKPVLVAYEFRHELERLLRAFPKTPFIGGGVGAKVADQIVQDWNAGRLPLLFGNPQSMGHGLNLQKGGASTLVWYTLPWDFELYDQTNRRLRRQGSSAERIIVHHLLAEDTVDRAVFHALRRKEKGQKALFDALKKYAGGRS